MRKQAILLAAIAALGANAQAPLWMRDVKISPDGSTIAFAYKGDIWSVPATGGQATRLTSLPSYEAVPVWSPDGKRIAFSSDRFGNNDIFVMDAAGGAATRLTSDSASETPEAFTPDGSEVLYSAAIQAPAVSAAFPSGRMPQLWAARADGSGARRQVLATPAQKQAYLPDGGFLYQDLKGFEDEWRKHHTSSVTRDLWRYDAKTGRHTNLTSRGGEDRDPVFDPATSTVYFLSERDGGTMNVYRAPLADLSKPSAVTSFKTHPVRFLSRANDGTLAFTYDGEIYTIKNGGAPAKLAVSIAADDAPAVEKIALSPRGAVPSPDGKMMAFTSRGDVFVTSVEYPTTRQVTSTPQAERHISWGADNRSLYYTSERSGRKNIYRATLDREADPDFPNATSIKEEPLFDDGAEYSHPLVSPDGKKLAFVKNRREIWVKELPSGKARKLTSGETYPGRDDGMVMTWSPDSRWMALEVTPKMHDPYSDIALLNMETGELTNITRSGYFDASPRFTQDGNAILFFTDRYGLRAHASWGSQTDLMIVFLNREARDRFDLGKEDLALLKDAEKKAEKASKADDGDKKGKKDKKAKKEDSKDEKADKVKPIVVELDGIDTRVRRLTPYSADIIDAIGSADGETIYYVVSFGDDYSLYKLPVREMEPEKVAALGAAPAGLSASADGKTIFACGRAMKKLDGSKLTEIKTSGRHTIDTAKEREAMFDYVAVEEGERFYREDMHGVDWPAMTAAYRRFLPHINNNYDFAEMLSELLGELNVSHTGGRYRPSQGTNADRTANLGLLYDLTYSGDGLKVDEVIVGGPFDKAASKMVPGAVVTSINGAAVTPSADLAELLTDLSGRKTLVEFTLPSGEKVSEVVRPVSSGVISDLMYKRWVRARAADVDRWSNGRLGYVHIESMADESFRPMYADLFGKYNNREGVVVDIRWNGGGRMHEDIEALLTGQKYLTQVIRGEETCDMPSRRWNKPSIMVMAEPCYSNAHGTPWVYKHQKIGKLVGMPVPGTMTSVNWVTLQDPTLVFGIPVIGYRTAEGTYLENSQLEPDVKVVNTPEAIAAGEDLQLRAAVETLLRDIDSAKKSDK